MAVIGTISGHELGLAVSAFFVPRIVQAESQPARNLSPPDLTLEGLRLADVDYAAPAALGGCSGGGEATPLARKWDADERGWTRIVVYRYFLAVKSDRCLGMGATLRYVTFMLDR